MIRAARRCSIALAVALTATGAAAQNYPVKPVRVAVGFAAGASTDIVARIVAQKLGEQWNQSVIVENRPGAGTNIAAEAVAKSPPDGYTLLIGQNALAISRALYPKLGYDPLRDLAPVGAISSAPHILLVHPSFPAQTVPALIALAKKRPGELTYGSSGVGINDHMCGELLKTMARIDLLHVPYKGGNQAAADVIGGQIAFYFSGMPVGLPLHKSGRLRGIAVTSASRYEGAPEVPTMAESGLPGYEAVLWQAMFAPAGVPPALLAKIAADLARVRENPEARERLKGTGVDVFPADAAKFGAFFRAETEKWQKVIAAAGIRLE